MNNELDDPRITAYCFDELTGDELAEFESQLRENPDLRAMVEEIRGVTTALTSQMQFEEQPKLADSRREQIESARRLAASEREAKPENKTVRKVGRSAWRTPIFALASAATLLVAVYAGRSYFESPQAKTVAQEDHVVESNAGDAENISSPVNDEVVTLEAPLISDNFLEASKNKQVDLDFGVHNKRRVDVARGSRVAGKSVSSRFGELPFGNVTGSLHEGSGPRLGGDQFSIIDENIFHRPLSAPKSTFSIDVDTASYAKVRMFLSQNGTWPRPDAVRIEEMINYFAYNYEPPTGGTPFSSKLNVSDCPWEPMHRIVRVAIQGREVEAQRPHANLVFLMDVSGSMDKQNKLPLLKRSMKLLAEKLGENDRVAIVVYAGAAGLVLPSTIGTETHKILNALDRLSAGGSTNGGQGIELAYQTALENFRPGGSNRVILCTDGDFNVGTTGTDALIRLAADQAKAGVQLTVLGFGMGNHNDSMLEQISNRADGNYAFIDTINEARKVLVEQLHGTLVTIAKDVKIQVEFNPTTVAAYRLIGYENRMLKTEDFDDDKKDAGEIGAGHRVTALYEVIPAGVDSPRLPKIAAEDKLKYQNRKVANGTDDLLTLYVRYKDPEADTSKKLTFVLTDNGDKFGAMDDDFRFATAVASFGMLLRGSEFAGDTNFAAIEEIAGAAMGEDLFGYRKEFMSLVKRAAELQAE
jgi:secreted protein with Ig-like and vWFA domain